MTLFQLYRVLGLVSEQCLSDCGKCVVYLQEDMVPANQSPGVHLGRKSAKMFIVYRDKLTAHLNRCTISSTQCRTAITTTPVTVVRIPKGIGRGTGSAINGVKKPRPVNHPRWLTLVMRIVILYFRTRNSYPVTQAHSYALLVIACIA